MNKTIDRQFKLGDGRTLGYAEYGDPAGKPLIYCHGFPASRLEGRMIAPAAERQQVRVISVDRPGYGLSDFQPERRLNDWPDDICALSDALSIQRFAVLGISGGGPYALACAWKVPMRLTAVGVVCGLGPVYEPWAIQEMKWPARLGFETARRARWLLPAVYGGIVARIMRWRPATIQALVASAAPKVDRKVLQRPEIQDIFVTCARDALRQGPRGALWDFVLYAHYWGFQLQDIDLPVHLWQGEADATVPPSHMRHQAKVLPNGRARFLADEGHFSLPINHMDEIMATLFNI